VVRIPEGTAHSLYGPDFPIPVMGKTGTTSDFRDALFVGSTYGPEGVTVAVRIGFDDNSVLGNKETGGHAALPIFREIMLRVYHDKLVGPVPQFPREIEDGIDAYLALRPRSGSRRSAARRSQPQPRCPAAPSGSAVSMTPPARSRGAGDRRALKFGRTAPSARGPAAGRRVFPDHRPAATRLLADVREDGDPHRSLTVSYLLLVFAAQACGRACRRRPASGSPRPVSDSTFNTTADTTRGPDRRWINKLMAMTLDFIGGSSYLWHWKHDVIHHTYVNVTGHDSDLNLGIFGRVTPHQRRLAFHRWQHLYLWPLYGFLAIRWQLIDDFRRLTRAESAATESPSHRGDLIVRAPVRPSFSPGHRIPLHPFRECRPSTTDRRAGAWQPPRRVFWPTAEERSCGPAGTRGVSSGPGHPSGGDRRRRSRQSNRELAARWPKLSD
jgi:hypothetical protein